MNTGYFFFFEFFVVSTIKGKMKDNRKFCYNKYITHLLVRHLFINITQHICIYLFNITAFYNRIVAMNKISTDQHGQRDDLTPWILETPILSF